MGDTVNLIADTGETVTVPAEQAAGLVATKRYHAETGADAADRSQQRADDAVYGGAAGATLAGLASVAGGATGGLTDAAIAGMGGGEQLRKLKEHHQAVSIGGEILGTLMPTGIGGVAGRAGGAVEKALGQGVLGGAGRMAAEGAIYGAGSGISEVALSDHPLTAEYVASTLSSNILTGAGIGGVTGGAFKLAEKGLERASIALEHASQTRAAIEGVPADLAHLDEAGLREASKTAKVEHEADIAAEKQSLEQLRNEKRAELASQVKDFHNELATERPIFQAVAGDDIRKVANIGTEVASPLNKSYRALRSAFDNPIAIAENPGRLLQPLQMQQTALENLQARAGDLHAAFPGDARLEALSHVDGALEQNKAFQQAIRQLDKSTPLAGGRLTALESGPSQKMLAIDNAREALKKAPELGLAGKAATGAAFAGATALAHMIPGVGIAAPFLGKAASEFVGAALGKVTNASRAVAEKSSATLKAFLNASHKAEKFVPVTATKVLGAVRFGAGPEPRSPKLHDVYTARSQEIRQQTMYAPDGSVQMRPEARMAMAKRLDPIRAVNPIMADQIETTAARKITYYSSQLPRHPEVGGLQIGPDTWRPSELEVRRWARVVRAGEDPGGVEERLLHGNVTPDEAQAYRAIYPERFAAMQQAITTAAPTLAKTLPMKRKIALSIFTGVPLIPALQPNVLAVLQGNYATESGSAGGTQAPAAQPNYGASGSLKSSEKPTPAQAREGT